MRFAVQPEPRGTADAVLAARGVVRRRAVSHAQLGQLLPGAMRAPRSPQLGGAGLIAFEAETLVRESGIEPERVLQLRARRRDGRRLAARDPREARRRRSARAARRAVGVDEPLVVHAA